MILHHYNDFDLDFDISLDLKHDLDPVTLTLTFWRWLWPHQLYSGHIGEVTPNIEFSSYIQPDTHANCIIAFDKTMVQARMPTYISIASSGLTYTPGI